MVVEVAMAVVTVVTEVLQSRSRSRQAQNPDSQKAQHQCRRWGSVDGKGSRGNLPRCIPQAQPLLSYLPETIDLAAVTQLLPGPTMMSQGGTPPTLVRARTVENSKQRPHQKTRGIVRQRYGKGKRGGRI